MAAKSSARQQVNIHQFQVLRIGLHSPPDVVTMSVRNVKSFRSLAVTDRELHIACLTFKKQAVDMGNHLSVL